jgi:hypothetical protein
MLAPLIDESTVIGKGAHVADSRQDLPTLDGPVDRCRATGRKP